MKRVLWALDAFSQDTSLRQKATAVLKAWSKKSPLEIEPVYVLSPDQLSVPVGVFSLLASHAETEAKERMQSQMKRTRLQGVVEPTLLTSMNFSLRGAVDVLLDHARKTKAGFILVTTQSKKGVSRFLFGSFAESLVLQSEIPVFLVTPNTEVSALKRVLFSTDFGQQSREAFEALIAEAKEREFEVVVYNKFEFLVDTAIAPALSADVYKKIMQQDLEKRRTLSSEFVAIAEKSGVQATAIVDSNPKELNVSRAILKAAAKSKADTIAMASQSGRVTSALLGSVARQVIRNASLPVWVVHPKSSQ